MNSGQPDTPIKKPIQVNPSGQHPRKIQVNPSAEF